MGVRGLTNFIRQNERLLKITRLFNTAIVIDGNNLAYHLFYTSDADTCFGGDYDEYCRHVEKYFAILRKCKVNPYVIFDGGYDRADGKMVLSLERAKQRLVNVHRYSQYCSYRLPRRMAFTPLLLLQAFKEVLCRMNIPFALCDYEADSQIVAVANLLGCPVLSQDSDFYIFDIKGGFIPVDSVEMKIYKNRFGETRNNYLRARIYHVNDFIKCFPDLNVDVLPVFGGLVGNEIVYNVVFNKLFACPKQLKKHKATKYKFMQFREKQMIKILQWLKSRTAEDAVEHVIKHLKKTARKGARETILKAIQSYSHCRTSVAKHLKLPVEEPNEEEEEPLIMSCGGHFPRWFVTNFHSGDLSPFLLNAGHLRQVILLAQIEDFSYVTAYQCSLPIRQVVYGILAVTESQTATSAECVQSPFMEYCRKRISQCRYYVQPTVSLPEYGDLPTLMDIPKLSESSKKELVNAALKCKEVKLDRLPQNIRLILATIIYWINVASPPVSSHCLNALLIFIMHTHLPTWFKHNRKRNRRLKGLKRIENIEV